MKKTYIHPAIIEVNLQHQHIICESNYGMNRSLQSEEVDAAWTKENSGSSSSSGGWDDEW